MAAHESIGFIVFQLRCHDTGLKIEKKYTCTLNVISNKCNCTLALLTQYSLT